ncbi:MAG: hypothetical protein Kow0042_08230 [Calditrichia bacterium]
MRSILIPALILFIMAGCSQKEKRSGPVDHPTVVAEDQYILTESGLKYADIVEGRGSSPKPGETVVVHYTGWLTDGKRFDSSVLRNKPFEFQIGQGRVISGWEEGVASMRVGGIRQLIIPPTLAYGERGVQGVIPPNSDLIFEIQLIDIKK